MMVVKIIQKHPFFSINAVLLIATQLSISILMHYSMQGMGFSGVMDAESDKALWGWKIKPFIASLQSL